MKKILLVGGKFLLLNLLIVIFTVAPVSQALIYIANADDSIPPSIDQNLTPAPDPTPTPTPNPTPDPNPIPTPTPDPLPDPASLPTPTPTPSPDPTPAPISTPQDLNQKPTPPQNKIAPQISQGAGISNNPYVINSCSDLEDMANDRSAYYVLGSNIDCNVDPYNTGDGFMPIGDINNTFVGHFDGMGYKISGLFINQPLVNNASLFGGLSTGAVITRVWLENVNITGGGTTGAISAYMGGGTISETYATGIIVGTSQVGGLIGEADGGSIDNSYSGVNVTGTVQDVGGFVGYSIANISNSFSYGSVGGGATSTGAFMGRGNGGQIFSNSFWDNQTAGQSDGCGGGNCTGLTSANTNTLKTKSTFVNAGWAFALPWSINGNTNNGYPFLQIATRVTTCGEFENINNNLSDVYILDTDLHCEGDGNSVMIGNLRNSIPFTGSFDGGGHTIYISIDDENGDYDGAGLFQYVSGGTIHDLNISGSIISPHTIGSLVSYADNSSDFYNVNSSVNITTLFNDNYYPEIGGLIGEIDNSTLENSSSTGTINASASDTLHTVGGLIGYSFLSTVSQSYETGNVTAGDYSNASGYGGLFGVSDNSTITESFASGNVDGGLGSNYVGGFSGASQNGGVYISDSYATGTVHASGTAGGFIGYTDGGDIIEHSYASGNVDGLDGGSYAGGFIGYTSSSDQFNDDFSKGNVISFIDNFGGFVGYDTGATYTNVYFDQINSQINTCTYQQGINGCKPVDTESFPNSKYFITNLSAKPMDAWDGDIWNQTVGFLPRLVNISADDVVVPSYRYLKWDITKRRDAGPDANCSNNCIQVGEFFPEVGGQIISPEIPFVATNPSGNNPKENIPFMAIDGNNYTKWQDNNFGVGGGDNQTGHSILHIDMGEGVNFDGYRWRTAGDNTARDPISWNLYASNDDSTWTLLDSRVNEDITQNRNSSVGTYYFNNGVVSNFAGGDGSSGNPYQITTCQQFENINLNLGAYYVLNNNIDCSSFGNNIMVGSRWTSLPFYGNFDGQDHTITIAIDDTFGDEISVGLFQYIDGASVQNLNIAGTITAMNNVGSFSADIENSLIGNIHSSVNIINVANNGSWPNIGGLVGYSDSTYFSNTSYSGNIISPELDNASTVGGLVGDLVTSTIDKSYVTGNLNINPLLDIDYSIGGILGCSNASDMIESYSTGSLSGPGYMGGLAGYFGYGDIDNSYSTSNVTGQTSLGGVAFYTDHVTISHSYASGIIDGVDSASNGGGLVTASLDTTFSNSFFTGNLKNFASWYGAIDGEDMGGNTFTNSYYNQVASGVMNCTNNGDISGCSPVNTIGSPDPSYFLNNFDNAPLDAWDSTTIWTTAFNHLPVLDRLASDSIDTFAGGVGTLGNPFQISTCYQLQNINLGLNANYVYVLNNNIDCSDTVSWNDGAGFLPIGPDAGNKFFGTLNGNGYVISNLYEHDTDHQFAGLFGITENGSLIKNVGLENVNIINTSGGCDVGGLVGSNYGSISNTYTTGTVTSNSCDTGGLVGSHDYSDTIINSHSSVNVTGTEGAGGLVGRNEAQGVIENSYATGDVIGTYNVGGFVGLNYFIIENSFATGTVHGYSTVGGFSGYNNSIVDKSYSSGSVMAEGITYPFNNTYIGGFSGYNYGPVMDSFTTSGIYFNNGSGYTQTPLASDTYIGNLFGRNSVGTIVNNYYDKTVGGQVNCEGDGALGGMGGGECATPVNTDGADQNHFVNTSSTAPLDKWNFSTLWKTNNSTLPILQTYSTGFSGAGDGTDLSPYLITSCSQFEEINKYDLLDKYFKLITNLDCTAEHNNIMVGTVDPFTGLFDGGGHTIAVDINDYTSFNVALFQNTNGAIIGDAHIAGSVTGSSFFWQTVAGLVGYANSSSVYDSSSSANITGGDNVESIGGLAGYVENNSEIGGSFTTGNVSMQGTNIDTGGGGLVGYAGDSNFYEDYAKGNVNIVYDAGGLIGDAEFSSITNSYAQGNVVSSDTAGGLVGYNYYTNINSSYASGDVTGNLGGQDAGGLVGFFDGAMVDSFATGYITNYNQDTGGMVGYDDGDTYYENSYYDFFGSGQSGCTNNGDQSGCSPVNDPISVNTSYFKTNSTNAPLNNWDFENIWHLNPGTYPTLSAIVFGSIDPTHISTCQQLVDINNNLSGSYVLDANLDCASLGNGVMIGDNNNYFTGSFDGGGHTINININAENFDVGLFTDAQGATIGNVNITGSVVSTSNNGYYPGIGSLVGYADSTNIYDVTSSATVTSTTDDNEESAVGGIVGYIENSSYIVNSVSSGAVTDNYSAGGIGGLAGIVTGGSLIDTSSSTGAVTKNTPNGLVDYGVGGLVGYMESFSTINQSFSTGDVSSEVYTGGLVGQANGFILINNAYSTGNVLGHTMAGGLVGQANNIIDIFNSYSSGNVTGDGSGNVAGGFVGWTDSNVNIYNSFSAGAVSNFLDTYAGFAGYYGYNSVDFGNDYYDQLNSNSDNCTSNEGDFPGCEPVNTIGSPDAHYFFNNTFNDPISSWDFYIWHTQLGTYPKLTNAQSAPQDFDGGTGTVSDPYKISKCTQLSDVGNYQNDNFILTNNIDCTDTINWSNNFGQGFSPIVDFSGSFNGQGYTINHLYENLSGASAGLFSNLNSDGKVYDLNLENVNFATNQDNVGAVTAVNYGHIENVYTSGTVSGAQWIGGIAGHSMSSGHILNSYSSVAVSATDAVGGIVGQNEGIITNTFATGSVVGSQYAGGLSGLNYGTISNSYATGSVTGYNNGDDGAGLSGYNAGSISNSFATGFVSSFLNNTGGITGVNGGTLTNNFYDYTNTGVVGCAHNEDVSGCSPVNTDGFDPNYFKDTNANAPLASWNFTSTWQANADNLPTLRSNLFSSTYSGSGEGTANNKYQISTCAQFEEMDNVGLLDKHYLLMNSLECADEGNHIMIGTKIPFSGVLDGGGNSIDVNIDDSLSYAVGLLQNTNGASILNLVVNGNINSTNASSGTGALFGSGNNLTLTNIVSNANVTSNQYYTGGIGGYVQATNNYSSVFSNINSNGIISGIYCVGGLFGYMDNVDQSGARITLSNSTSTSMINSSSNQIGGLIGSATISGRYQSNDTAGLTISNSSHTVGLISDGYDVGGLIGQLIQNNSSVVSITNSFAENDISNGQNSDTGGLIGNYNNYEGTLTFTGNHYSGNVTNIDGDDYTGGLFGYFYLDQENGNIDISVNISNNYSTGTVEGYSNTGGLIGNLDLENWVSNRSVNFTMENNYSTSNVSAEGGAIGGLVGNYYLYNESNTGFTNNFNLNYFSGDVQGNADVGGLIGVYDSTDNSNDQYILSSLMDQNYSTGHVTGYYTDSYAGGFIGEYAYSGGIPLILSNSYSTSTVTGINYVGGLIGSMDEYGILSSVYFAGNVVSTDSGYKGGGLIGETFSSALITDSFVKGNVSGFSLGYAALVGDMKGEPVISSNNYYDKTASGGLDCAGYSDVMENCTAVNTDGSDANYFVANDSNAPLTSWDFSGEPIWDVNTSHLPTLHALVSDDPIGAYTAEYWSGIVSDSEIIIPDRPADLTTNTDSVNYDWGYDGDPVGVGNSVFTARYTETVDLSAGNYIFTVGADDEARVYVDDNLILDHWYYQGSSTSINVNLDGGNHTIRVEYLGVGVPDYLHFGYVLSPFDGGTGLSGDPYQISTCQQFMDINDFLSSNFVLENDLHCAGNGNNIMVGSYNQETGFHGEFDGGGHTIDFAIDDSAGNSDGDGLFQYVFESYIHDLNLTGTISSIHNVGALTSLAVFTEIVNVNSSVTVTAGPNGGFYPDIGGLVGFGLMVGINLHTTGDVNASTSDTIHSIGGLIGAINGSPYIAESSSTGNVTAPDNDDQSGAGGLIGIDDDSHLYSDFAIGNVHGGNGNSYVGGLVGASQNGNLDAENSYARGNVSGANYVGGFIGYLDGTDQITNSYSTGNVDGIDAGGSGGGFVGYSSGNDSLTNLFSVGTVSNFTTDYGGFAGYLSGDDTILNDYFDKTNSGQNDCVFGQSINGCSAVNTDGNSPNYFKYNNYVAPLSSWSFTNDGVWGIVPNDFPQLTWMLDITGPTVTSSVSNVTKTSATLNGNITDTGGQNASIRGFYWGTTGDYGQTITQNSGPYGTGAFSTNLSNLSCGTTYHFASYAVNSYTQMTTEDSTFTTSSCSNGGGGGGGGGGGWYVAPTPTPTTTNTCQSGYVLDSSNKCVIVNVNNTQNNTTVDPYGVKPIIAGSLTGYKFPKNLAPNSTDISVKRLQIFLNANGFLVAKTGPGSPGQETNLFGPATKKALIAFQEYHFKQILAPQGLKKGTGLFWTYSRKVVNEILAKTVTTSKK